MSKSKTRPSIPATVADLPPITPEHELGGRLRLWVTEHYNDLSLRDMIEAATNLNVSFILDPRGIVRVDVHMEPPANDDTAHRLPGL